MHKLLKKYFGYDEFRPRQEEIIQNIVSGKDTFVLMPTGGGKSLCYQLPALGFSGLTLVISPLIALMKDQVDALKANGISAEFMNSSLSDKEAARVKKRVLAGEVKLLYVAPERFAVKSFRELVQAVAVSQVAVDEAHCISEWGHDFRPDYRNLGELKRLFPEAPLVALTATATPRVRQDILEHLYIPAAAQFRSSFNRENLNIRVLEKKQAFTKLVRLLEGYRREPVVIYCFSRKETEDLAHNLRLNNFNAIAYHAGLEPKDRRMIQDRFVTDQANIIVATIAFGMGIDKPDVRLIVHYTFPKSLEGYYQEIGRAGRDGLPSECVMFYTYADLKKHEFFISQAEDSGLRQTAQEKLEEVMRFAELQGCRKKYLLKYFGEELEGDNCGSCDFCLTERETFDATVIAQKILSAVYKTGSRFGRNQVLDVLLGKNTQKVRLHGHDKLSVFGIAGEMEEEALGQVVKQLVDNGYLAKTPGQYPVLRLTRQGADFLQAGKRLELIKPVRGVEPAAAKSAQAPDYHPELFERLRALRSEVAGRANVPPFVVFGNQALQEMAFYLPQDRSAFSRITGVGKAKLDKYADTFLAAVKEFVNETGAVPPEQGKPATSDRSEPKVRQMRFYSKTKELLDKKIPVTRIAKRQGLKPATVINHIEKLLDAGERLDLEYLKLPSDRYENIKSAFQDCGDEKLKPVYEHLEGKYSYDELRLIRVLLRA